MATPDFWHAEHAIAALKKGLHVYCEKEMSNDIEKAKQMVLTARETGKLLQIGHQRRSNPRYIHCYEKLMKEANLLNQVTTSTASGTAAAPPAKTRHGPPAPKSRRPSSKSTASRT